MLINSFVHVTVLLSDSKILRVVILVDGDRPLFAVLGDVHIKHPRHVLEVRHLETVR